MALYITNDCINYNTCADECPVNAVYPGSILRESNEDVIPPVEIDHCFIDPDDSEEIMNKIMDEISVNEINIAGY